MINKNSLAVRLMRWTRFGLMVLIAVLAGMILTTPQDDLSKFPRLLNRAKADGVAAAPGYLVTSLGVGTNERFYVVDNQARWIGCYGLKGDELRLHAARRFDNDVEVLEGAYVIKNQAFKIEGSNGASRDQLKGFGKKQEEEIEALVTGNKKKSAQ